jgi:hypothetical protein
MFTSPTCLSQCTTFTPLDQSVLDQVLNLKLQEKEQIVMPGEQQFIIDESQEGGVMDLKGRNSKTPKKANHGARPCSSVMRKLKRQGWFKKITSL